MKKQKRVKHDYADIQASNFEQTLESKHRNRMLARATGHFWWITGTCRNRPVLLGPFISMEEAEQVAFSKEDLEDYNTISLPTRNTAIASQYLKGRRATTEHEELGQSMRRLKHKI